LVLRRKTTEAAGAAARTERATEIAETRTGDVLIVAVAGRLDAANAPALGHRLRAAIDAGHRALVVDARRIDFVGSAGVQVLLAAAKRLAPAGGRIALAGLADALREVFELAGLGSAFAFHRTPSAAVAALASSASHT
jgi:anti-sigma B factor antagonist